MSMFELLPDELILMILYNLSLPDINRMAVVSSRMFAIASTPKLWANMVVAKKTIRKLGIDHLLNIKRFQDLVSLDLSGMMGLSTAQFKKLLNFSLKSKLKSLDLSSVKMDYANFYIKLPKQMPCTGALANISPDLLARAVNRLEIVNLSGTYVTLEQALAIFKQILVSTNLSELSIGGLRLREVPVDLFVNALAKIKKVEIFATITTSGDNVSRVQVKALLLKLQEKTVLKTLDIDGRSFREIEEANTWAKNNITRPVRIYSKLKKNSEVYQIVRDWKKTKNYLEI